MGGTKSAFAANGGSGGFIIGIPNFFDIFSIASSFSLRPSPCSNAEMADWKQPTSLASSVCEMRLKRLASWTFRPNSLSRFVTADIILFFCG